MTSVDGQDPSKVFNDNYIPFVSQSPLLSYVPILTTACFKALGDGIDIEKSIDVVAARVKLISLINDHLSASNRGISDEAIMVVMSMASNEVISFFRV